MGMGIARECRVGLRWKPAALFPAFVFGGSGDGVFTSD